MADKENPPAFPVIAGQQVYTHGMTMRDYFAAQVISYSFTAHLSATDLADQAYEIADAMMARREK